MKIKATVLVRHNAGVPLAIESISPGGARLVGEISVEVGDRIQILFEIEGHPVEIAGEVVRTKKLDVTTDYIAVRFVDLDDEAKVRVEHLVRVFLDFEEQRMKS